MAYDFDRQYAAGKRGEDRIDALLRPRGQLERASLADERRGIDRFFTDDVGHRYSLEYKTDYVAQRTHNAFLETVSVDTAGKAGWVYTCEADFLLYYVPADEVLYWLRPEDVRHFVGHLTNRQRLVSVPNRDYHTQGFVVPLRCLERLAVRTDSL